MKRKLGIDIHYRLKRLREIKDVINRKIPKLNMSFFEEGRGEMDSR
ncbi:MAG: hypothetical protein RMJ37_02480 [Spirochaetia bacterium]|nr:hypothetical protein [Spirochaetota bacterium]MCX8096075.1 hypothetical protein [Spirochaetota bacterium]MDW8112193.1 hypothetical protein [Spirochaetia bacterium]